MKVEVAVLDSPSLIVLMVSVDVKRHLKKMCGCQNEKLSEGRGGRPGLSVPNSPYGLYGRKATLEEDVWVSE